VTTKPEPAAKEPAALKALIAMSGGVDSSVAAYLMKERGFVCVGVTMKLYSNEDIGEDDAVCCSVRDADDARAVARALGIPHYVFNFTGDFRQNVIRRFVEAYERGRTPNPCVDCNRFLKFDRLLRRAIELDCSHLVTGHYARIEKQGNGFVLKKALDETKDQSYFLYALTQKQLAHTIFPLGELKKTDVREIAERQGFRNARKRESQDICFVPDGDYARFIEHDTGRELPPGDFVDEAGAVLGQHRGQARYTVGQRKGLGSFPGRGPLFVRERDAENNTVTLGGEESLYSKTLLASEFNWIAPPPGPVRVQARTRYRQAGQWATAERTGEDTARVEFDEPQRAVAPGQAVVLYDGDTVVGGGTIEAERGETGFVLL
jgi:tRNA-specific 2-thiouridylase